MRSKLEMQKFCFQVEVSTENREAQGGGSKIYEQVLAA
jgi:hypothetical protein